MGKSVTRVEVYLGYGHQLINSNVVDFFYYLVRQVVMMCERVRSRYLAKGRGNVT